MPDATAARVGDDALAGFARPVTLEIIQPALAGYRVPVFAELASRPNVRLTVRYGSVPGLPNVAPAGFQGEAVPLHKWRVGGERWAFWQPAHLDAGRADVTFFLWDVQYLSLLPGLITNRRRGGKSVLWGHGYSRQPRPWRDRLRNTLGKVGDAVLVYNQRTAEMLVAVHGFERQRVFVAQNTTDTSSARNAARAFVNDPQRQPDFQAKHNLTGGPLFVQIGRNAPMRRTELLIAAFARVRRQRPDAQLAFIGSGYDEPALDSQLHELRLATGIHRPGAIYDDDELAPWFASAIATVFADAIGLSLLHSFGFGVPVITHDDRWQNAPEVEALVDGQNGLMFARGDVEALADAMLRLTTDSSLQQRLAAEAYRTAQQVFTVERMVDGFIDAARFVLGSETKLRGLSPRRRVH